VKIGPVDPEIIGLKIYLKENKNSSEDEMANVNVLRQHRIRTHVDARAYAH